MNTLHLRDTPVALIIIYSSFVTPFVIWIMRGYIETISPELDDAARVDGCSRVGVLWRVIIPVAIPGLVSTACRGSSPSPSSATSSSASRQGA